MRTDTERQKLTPLVKIACVLCNEGRELFLDALRMHSLWPENALDCTPIILLLLVLCNSGEKLMLAFSNCILCAGRSVSEETGI